MTEETLRRIITENERARRNWATGFDGLISATANGTQEDVDNAFNRLAELSDGPLPETGEVDTVRQADRTEESTVASERAGFEQGSGI